MKQLILGTAGHIDHGKSALVKALTGIDPDRLKEEKERGITIELGFAYLDLPSGQRIGIVDVPGHEKFVKHMVAGAGGIDVVMLVIAADEGVMPQTQEHLDICHLLGVTHGLVALTKTDLVDQELRELAMEDVTDFVKGTFLEGAPIVPVSAVTREGLEDLIARITSLMDVVAERGPDGPFRLPVDRVFTIKGFGTVVTGTIVSGSVNVGDTIHILPKNVPAKVRGLQVHNERVEQAVAGQRAAVNLQGVERSSVVRGEVVLTPGTVESSRLLDVELLHLPHAAHALKNGTELRFHTGTSLHMGTLLLLGTNELKPGERGYAQVRLDEPVVALPGDRFVLRGSSRIQTIGGGTILDAHPPRHKRFKGDTIARLEHLKSGDLALILRHHIKNAGPRGIETAKLAMFAGLSRKVVSDTLAALLSRREVVRFDKDGDRVIDGDTYQTMLDTLLTALERYHADNPLKTGAPKEELKSKLPRAVDAKLFNVLLSDLVQEKHVVQEQDKVRLLTHEPALKGKHLELEGAIETTLRESGLTPPTVKELVAMVESGEREVKEILARLVGQNILVKLKDDIYMHRDPLDDLKERLVQFFRVHEKMTTQDFKTLTGASRKFTIPLAEYFDASKITIRVGDDRILRGDRR